MTKKPKHKRNRPKGDQLDSLDQLTFTAIPLDDAEKADAYKVVGISGSRWPSEE